MGGMDQSAGLGGEGTMVDAFQHHWVDELTHSSRKMTIHQYCFLIPISCMWPSESMPVESTDSGGTQAVSTSPLRLSSCMNVGESGLQVPHV